VAARRLRGRRVLVFKPGFGIATPWAYGRLAAAASAPGANSSAVYLPAAKAEARLAAWLAEARAPAEKLLFNNMEPPAGAKFLALPALLERLRRDFALEPRMSGSGSACFAFLPEAAPSSAGEAGRAARIVVAIRAAWGDSAFVIETRLV